MSAGDLDGVGVLDLSRLLPGPYCSLLLAELGADVLRVQAPGAADPADDIGLDRGKRSIALDLKTQAGRDELLGLARGADVLLESFRPGVMARLGLGADTLLAANPRLVVCSISAHGQEGPLRDRPAHDLNVVGRSGLLALTGAGPDDPPIQPAGQIADHGAGLYAALRIVAALRRRDRTGEGQVLDVSMAEVLAGWLSVPAAPVLAGGPPAPRGRGVLEGGALCYRPYRCADGGWVTFAALEPKFWQAWCDGVGREDLLAHQFDAPGSPAHAEVESLFASRTRAEWEDFAARVDCCVEPILELAEVIPTPDGGGPTFQP